ncbi:MAG: hypothetical protein FWF51_06200 [Chitinivibrionia bacterium]|nr:hypothetical protein [Chitinivibrionia bacterium]
MKNFMFILALALTFSTIFAQDDLRLRAMTKNTIFYATPDGKVTSADYWQMRLGNFDVTVTRKYPGEGDVKIEGSANIAFMSGGYLEGNGFGSRGKLSTQADFAVKRDGKYQTVRPDTIDYIFFGASKVKLKGLDKEEDLFVYIEDPYNTYEAKMFNLAVYVLSKNTGELTHSHDIERLSAVSFTEEGAKKGHQANIAEASR